VLLTRHAECVDVGRGIGELARHLTLEGRRDAARAASVISAKRVEPAVILTSPLVRAVQTAEVLAAGLIFSGEVRSSLTLAPGAAPELLLDALTETDGDVIAVGHAPDM